MTMAAGNNKKSSRPTAKFQHHAGSGILPRNFNRQTPQYRVAIVYPGRLAAVDALSITSPLKYSEAIDRRIID